MAIGVKQTIKQSQQLLLSPQIQQAIKLLTLGRLELEEFVTQELHSNPCLEEQDNGYEGVEQQIQPAENFLDESGSEREQGKADFEAELLSNLHSKDDSRGMDELFERFADTLSNVDEKSSWDDESGSSPAYELFNVKAETLHDNIEEQVKLMHLTAYEYECINVLLQYIDDNGFLTADPEEIATEHDLNIDDLNYALSVIRRCEPVGIGARTVQESLLLQVAAFDKIQPLVKTILQDFWTEFEKQDFAKIQKALKITKDDFRSAINFIREKLDPRPARQFGENHNQIITPDVFVFKRANTWIVSLNEDGLPRLKVSQRYEKLVEDITKEKRAASSDDKKLKEFVNDKVKDAKWLVRALNERNKTILRVAEAIVNKQVEFFELGIEHLRPLTLKAIAEELSLHESTISRTTTNKYIHSPRGIFELKYFFNAGMNTSEGVELANEAIKNWVAEYIRQEASGKPLSDQDIANLIEKEKTIKVARRTVAKYRESLGLPPSSKRGKMSQFQ